MVVTDAGDIWISGGRFSATAMSDSLFSLHSSFLNINGTDWARYTAKANNSANGSWGQIEGDIPLQRTSHGMVAIGRQLWLMGGLASNGSVHSSDLYMLDTSRSQLTWVRKKVSSSVLPEARSNFGMLASGTTIFVSFPLCLVHFSGCFSSK
jgi:hypothetical protein